MEPAKRLGIYSTILDEQTQREAQYERYYGNVVNHSSKSHQESITSRGAALTSLVSPSRAKKVLAGYESRGEDAKMHVSREQTGEEVGGLDGERP
ncbi:MAG TPA: hypothetical protein VF558_04760, partial [Rubrobacteraceae bacterium]